jgi:predicted transcriptional regulator
MDKSGNIYFIEAESDFKKVHKSIIKNENIDCTTLGIYVKIITFSKDWQLNIKGLSSVLNLSDSKIRTSITLLEKEGYITRHSVKDEQGKFNGWNYNIYSIPTSDVTQAGKRTCQKTDTPLNGQDQEPTSPKTDITENGEENNIRHNEHIDLNNKEEINNTKTDASTIDYNYIKQQWCEHCSMLAAIRGINTKRKKAIANTLKSNNANVDDLIKCFKIIATSEFCKGDNKQGWKATFDWIINDTKSCFNRLLEGEFSKNMYERKLYEAIIKGSDSSNDDNVNKKILINGVEYK